MIINRARLPRSVGKRDFSTRSARIVRLGAMSLGLAGAIGFNAPVAVAQETVLIPPALPYSFDKGRNLNVNERPRPDYDPLGFNIGSFVLLPRVQTGIGYSDNIYLTSSDTTNDAYVAVQPDVRFNSNWQRHQLQFYGNANLKRYLSEPRRNEDAYALGTRGRLEGGLDYLFSGEAAYAKQYESPLSADVQSNLAVLSSYNKAYVAGRAERRVGHSRIIIGADYTNFDFSSIQVDDTTTIDQSDRNREITRASAQFEYAWTPSISSYVQGAYDWTNYDRLLSDGSPNRDSRAWRLIGGFNFDLTGFLRGTLGAGYVKRNFRSSLYDDVDGLSVEGKVEYFPTQLTTYTLTARRLLNDASIGNQSAYVDSRLGARVDHELLRNLILNASGDVAFQNFSNSPVKSRSFRIAGGGRYLVNRQLGFEFGMSYMRRTRNDDSLGNEFNEFGGMISLILQR